MGSSLFNMRSFLALFLLVVQIASALKFDLHSTSSGTERCIRNFVAKDQLVVVTAIVGGTKGDGQRVDMHVSSSDITTFAFVQLWASGKNLRTNCSITNVSCTDQRFNGQ